MNRFKILCLMALSVILLSACSSNDDEDNPVNPANPGTVVNGVMKDITLSGIVKDTDGNPVAGVTVSTGESVVTTNAAGLFSFTKVDVVSNRSLVRFAKLGYFDVVRSLKSETEDTWDVVICKKGNGEFSSTATYTSSSAKDLKAAEMKIALMQDGYVTDATGKAFSGQVNAEVVYLDPNNENFADMMPGGDLAAVRSDGSEAQLVSYGMTAVNLADNDGNKLQLKDGSPATLTFPIPEGMTENLPASIPLWSFNEATGLWEEEGEAVLQGDVYVGQVKHFSWVNLDYPEEQATIEGYVKNSQGKPVPAGTIINVGQVTTKTKANGYYKQEVVARQDFEISIKSKNYGNYRNVYSRPVTALEPRETKRIDITLPTLYHVSGRIVNNGGGANIASIYIGYGNKKTTSVVSNTNGIFSLYAPEGYSGTATLFVTTMDGDVVTKEVSLGGGNVNVGDIVISSATGSGGQMGVRLSDGTTATLNIQNPADNGQEGGVLIMDDRLMVFSEEESEKNYFGLQIEGYDASKNSFENASVGVRDGSQQLYSDGNASVTIGKKSGKFIFGISGIGNYYDSNGKYDDNAFFSANDVTIDLYMVMNSYRNVNPKDIGAPSFTPVLSSKAPLVKAISESKEGTGVIIYYNGTKSDFQKLKSQADKSGIKKVDEEDDEGYVEVMYYSNNKLIMLEYDPEGKTVNDDFDAFDDDDPQIYVSALENVPASALYFSRPRSSLSRQIKKCKKG